MSLNLAVRPEGANHQWRSDRSVACAKLQGPEVGHRALITRDELAVDHQRVGCQRCKPAGDGRQGARVVVAVPEENRDLVPGLVQLHAPAVEFDFMKPARAAGRDGSDAW